MYKELYLDTGLKSENTLVHVLEPIKTVLEVTITKYQMLCYYEGLKFIWSKTLEEGRSKSTVFASGWLCHVSQHVRDTMGLDRTDLANISFLSTNVVMRTPPYDFIYTIS